MTLTLKLTVEIDECFKMHFNNRLNGFSDNIKISLGEFARAQAQSEQEAQIFFRS